MIYLRNRICACLLAFFTPLSAQAHTQPNDLEEVVVSGRQTILIGEARSASEGVIGQMDLAIRPLLRPGDVLEAVPGLIVTQHSGSGKSNQMFLRGFNLDHGTDFATWIDGMPVNMRTHGHGQGYTDINFLIPETIERMTFVKGPYHAELGDFSSAGGVNISTFNRLDNQVSAGVGQDGYRKLLAMGGVDFDSLSLSGAIEGMNYDGPWTDISEDVEKLNGLMTLAGGDNSRAWSSTLMYYQNEWNSADQIPRRAVREGLISDLGSIDTATGGKTHRASLSGQYSLQEGDHRSQWSAYIIDYELDLWSNFTYFLEDPVNGDEFQQVDDRTISGGAYRRYWGGGEQQSLSHSLGAEFRYDDIDTVGLYNTR
ncbi:MAG: TonB-dependent receptor plug domain-containing protein, partial [Pseudomonadota bacterium]